MNLFKDYKGTNNISATPYGLGDLLVTVYGDSFQEQASMVAPIMGEVLIQTIAHSTLDNFTASQDNIIQALYYLNARVESVRKTITTWDAYQIKGALQDRDTILAQLAQLPANSSIVSNLAEPFQWFNGQSNVTVFRGDILLKDSEENIIHIPSLSSGYYAPVSMTPTAEGATTYQIQFHYFTHTPQPGTTINPNPSSSNFQPTETIQFNNIDTHEDYWGYQLKGTLAAGAESDHFTFKSTNGLVLKPIVKFFTSTSNGEQVYLDKDYTYVLEDNEEKFYFSNNTSIELYYEVK